MEYSKRNTLIAVLMLIEYGLIHNTQNKPLIFYPILECFSRKITCSNMTIFENN